MAVLRGWIYYLVLAVTLVPLAIVILLLYPFSLSVRYRLAMSWARLTRIVPTDGASAAKVASRFPQTS